MARGKNLPEAWENSLLLLWKYGIDIPTQYDREGDPPSKECLMVIQVENPFNEPRIHRALPCGIDALQVYIMEVLEGIHDHWIGEGGWPYTYHQRLRKYEDGIDQIGGIVKLLSESPISRRAVTITWEPKKDLGAKDPPCLIYFWFRVLNGRLNLHTHMRSNDAFKAAFLNMIAFTEFQRWIAENLSLEIGEYYHIVDSYHLYGAYIEEFKAFLKSMKVRSFEDRTYCTTDPEIQRILQETRDKVIQSLEIESRTGRKGL